MDNFDFGDFNYGHELPSHYAFELEGVSFEYRFDDSIIPNEFVVDWDGDGQPNSMFQLERDSNGLFTHSTHVDLDGDGHFDLAEVDLNGDFWPDLITVDVDGPGGESYTAPTSSAGVTSFLTENAFSGLEAWAALDSAASEPLDSQSLAAGLFGEGVDANFASVDQWSEHWHAQDAADSCAVCCQEFIIEAATGKEFSEVEMLNIASDLGVYDNAGTMPNNMGAILDYFGVENQLQEGLAIDELISLVNSGHGVSVAVDSYELEGIDDWGEAFGVPYSLANHAVQVTGFESSTEGNFVILNDPGHASGCAKRVPIDQFRNAWDDNNNFACVTTERIV